MSNLPAGNAIGTAFSGLYLAERSEFLGCICREGSCDDWSASLGSYTLVQADGALNVIYRGRYSETIYDGSINSDGSFLVGGMPEAEFVRGYSLLTGTVVAAGSINTESESTVVGRVNGKEFDCDLKAKTAGSYLAPLP